MPFSLVLLSACGTATEKVRPHLPATGDVYCTYKIKSGEGGVLKPGDTVCIYCAPPAAGRCDLSAIEVAEDVTYRLEKTAAGCSDCAAADHIYELLGD